jgi:ankyrin repeat protein
MIAKPGAVGGNVMRRSVSLLLLLAAARCAGTLPRADLDLFAAIKRGDTGDVERLLASGANVNGASEHGTTPLHVAAYQEDPVVAAVLIREGAAINARNHTPLEVAIRRRNDDVAEVLRQHGAR